MVVVTKLPMLSLMMVCALPLMFSSGCAQRITYPLRDVEAAENSHFHGKTLAVRVFEDVREPVADRRRTIDRGDGDWWFNNAARYRNQKAGPCMTRMVIRHIEAVQMFDAVSPEEERPDSDYLLKATITQFDGFSKRNIGSEIAKGFVAPWIVNLRASARYEAATSLDVSIIERHSGKMAWQGTAAGKIEGEGNPCENGTLAYTFANLSLKKAVNNMVEYLREIE